MRYGRNSISSSKLPKLPWVMYGTYILIPSSLPFDYLSSKEASQWCKCWWVAGKVSHTLMFMGQVRDYSTCTFKKVKLLQS